jgi:hypothetical protein
MGALLGDKPEKTNFVKCDRSTMTQNDQDNGRLVVLIGVAPLRPAEFIIFRTNREQSAAARQVIDEGDGNHPRLRVTLGSLKRRSATGRESRPQTGFGTRGTRLQVVQSAMNPSSRYCERSGPERWHAALGPWQELNIERKRRIIGREPKVDLVAL